MLAGDPSIPAVKKTKTAKPKGDAESLTIEEVRLY
jgi:hypothetical protein